MSDKQSEDVTYGAVAVIGGKHKGAVAYYDDDEGPYAIVYIGRPFASEPVRIRKSNLRNVTSLEHEKFKKEFPRNLPTAWDPVMSDNSIANANDLAMHFRGGTLVVDGLSRADAAKLAFVSWDERTLQHRTPAYLYRDLVTMLKGLGLKVQDGARHYQTLDLTLKAPVTPRGHQVEALSAWVKAAKRGTVCMPTGAGKTILAVLAVLATQRSTLVVVPTIDLMQQWETILHKHFGIKIGMVGGGSHEVEPLTVATYDSAYLHIDRLGDKFGFVIFDECHHLPAPQYQAIALGTIAPFRLGLSATVERADGKESVVYELVGPLVYEAQIRDMEAKTLAPYEVVTIELAMTEKEKAAYKEARQIYTAFLRHSGIRMDKSDGWMDFVMKSSRSPEGRLAMKAYWEQKRTAQASEGKLVELWHILGRHQGERALIFTDDNALAYRIGREFFVPVLTHKTRPKERKRMLAAFKEGRVTTLATSKVLNEGVDVPEASVGIVLSGSGAVREHVQRLGRILRHQEGKTAVMYELISKGTSEWHVNQRRREHNAYQGPATP